MAIKTSSEDVACRVRGRRGGVGGATAVLDRLRSGEGVDRNGNEGGVAGVPGRGLKIPDFASGGDGGVDPSASDLVFRSKATCSGCSEVNMLICVVV